MSEIITFNPFLRSTLMLYYLVIIGNPHQLTWNCSMGVSVKREAGGFDAQCSLVAGRDASGLAI